MGRIGATLWSGSIRLRSLAHRPAPNGERPRIRHRAALLPARPRRSHRRQGRRPNMSRRDGNQLRAPLQWMGCRAGFARRRRRRPAPGRRIRSSGDPVPRLTCVLGFGTAHPTEDTLGAAAAMGTRAVSGKAAALETRLSDSARLRSLPRRMQVQARGSDVSAGSWRERRGSRHLLEERVAKWS